MNVLIIGGTRNIGYHLTTALYERGHRVTLLNRGLTKEDLPEDIARLRCDRTEPEQLRRALAGRTFDIVVDNVLYKRHEAEEIVDILAGQVGHYIMLSSGQVYLVRDNVPRPATEDDYDGALMPPPEPNTYDYEEWSYGMGKRQAEDVLHQAWEQRQFPYTVLRLPMVNGERDTFDRLYGYILRIKDGGPILLPDAPNHPLRHVDTQDVVKAILTLIENTAGKGRAYNISQDETLSMTRFLDTLGAVMGKEPVLKWIPRDLLEAQAFLPDASPFSDLWMSEIDNARSKAELNMTYTPAQDYLARIVAYYEQNPRPVPLGYRRRPAEKQFVQQMQA